MEKIQRRLHGDLDRSNNGKSKRKIKGKTRSHDTKKDKIDKRHQLAPSSSSSESSNLEYESSNSKTSWNRYKKAKKIPMELSKIQPPTFCGEVISS